MLACDQTVTLVKCDGEDYTLTVIEGVSWFDKVKVALQDKGLKFANATKVRIPADKVPTVPPVVSDILVLGTVTGTIEKPADLAAYRRVTIMAVGDNRRGRLPHLAVIGQ